jgi:diaminohydroxyphosphoribosylaminopyrimidine deaminase/5-amino-6-(5-phosphoribosylamino)uracil reductase
MVGTNTALQDNPALNTRNWTGPDPVRLVVDMNLRLPQTLQIFDRTQKTIIFNSTRQEEQENLLFYKLDKEQNIVQALLQACHDLKLQSILIEGGNKLAESFINEGAWDEARVIENTQLIIDNGLRAPLLANHRLVSSETIATDVFSYYRNKG